MKKFGFKIQTRGGSTVENLVIQGRDREEAERKLRQVYHHCTILDEKVLADPVPEDASQLAPRQVLGYLRDLGVPLHVWTFGELESPRGQVSALSSFIDYERAAIALKRDLDSQRVVWVAGHRAADDLIVRDSGPAVILEVEHA